MYILSVISFFVLYGLYCIWSAGLYDGVMLQPWFFDFTLLLFVLSLPLLFLMFNRLFSDFLNAFGIVVKKKEAENLMELMRAQTAVKLAKNTVLGFSVFIALVQSVIAMMEFDDVNSVGYLLLPILLSVIYGMAIALILQPLQSSLELKILQWKQETAAK